MDINEAIQAVDHAATEVIAHNSAVIEQMQRKLVG